MHKRIHPVIGTPLVAFAAGMMMLASCGGGGGSSSGGADQSGHAQSTATPARQNQLLRDAARGTWNGRFGTLEFNGDGTASFVLKNCGFATVSPGVVTVDSSCDPTTTTGPVKVGEQKYTLGQPDGSGDNFDAWVDSNGKLHLGLGTVAFLGPNRSGTAQVGLNEKLTVEGNRCDDKSEFKDASISAPCHFVNKGGQVVLVYKARDDFDHTKTTDQGLVYFADSGLLVSPELVPSMFTKQ
jgi:hypothetical protein